MSVNERQLKECPFRQRRLVKCAPKERAREELFCGAGEDGLLQIVSGKECLCESCEVPDQLRDICRHLSPRVVTYISSGRMSVYYKCKLMEDSVGLPGVSIAVGDRDLGPNLERCSECPDKDRAEQL